MKRERLKGVNLCFSPTFRFAGNFRSGSSIAVKCAGACSAPFLRVNKLTDARTEPNSLVSEYFFGLLLLIRIVQHYGLIFPGTSSLSK